MDDRWDAAPPDVAVGPAEPASDVVRAAGGVPWRRGDDELLEVCIVHRTQRQDWSFPKGKLDPGEAWDVAAVREVFEETGLVAVPGDRLAAVEYVDHQGRPKQVRYWAMAVAADAGFAADDEVDERRWVTPEEAHALLDYEGDRLVLDELLGRVGA